MIWKCRNIDKMSFELIGNGAGDALELLRPRVEDEGVGGGLAWVICSSIES